MKTYPTSNAQAQMTHAAWDAALPFDMEDEARRNPFLAAHMAACDRKYGKRQEEESEDGE